MSNYTQVEMHNFEQLRVVLPAETTGHLDTVELSIEYQKGNLMHVEVWVRVVGDNVKGLIRIIEAENKNVEAKEFQNSLLMQVNNMPDISDYIDAWIYRRQDNSKA